MPTTRFRVTALARFAMAAAIFAQRSVKTTQRMRHVTSGMPPTRADEATDKPDEDTADDGFEEAFLRHGRGHLLFGRFDRL